MKQCSGIGMVISNGFKLLCLPCLFLAGVFWGAVPVCVSAAPALPEEAAFERSEWWPAIQDSIRQMEYDVTWQEKTLMPGQSAAYHMTNRAQDLRLYFAGDGFLVMRRMQTSPLWQCRLVPIGMVESGKPSNAVETTVQKNWIKYRREMWVERFENREDGIVQTGLFTQPPAGRGPLVLQVQCNGTNVRLSESGQSIEVFEGDQTALRYGPPVARDANGKDLPAALINSAGSYEIQIDDKGAAYPVELTVTLTGIGVAGLSALPNWAVLGNAEVSMFGLSVATAGDVNGDGYSDAIVGALNFDDGQPREGRAFVFHGSASGLSLTPDWYAESNVENAILGCSVSTAGDVNGDGYSDVIVGASDYYTSGTALLWLGSADGLGPNGMPGNADWQVIGERTGGGMGAVVATAGDVNGDGYSDVMVTESKYVSIVRESVLSFFFSPGEDMHVLSRRDMPEPQQFEERVHVYYGSPSGPGPSPDWRANSGTELFTTVFFGFSIGTAGDVNGDGYGDVIVSSPLFMLTGRAFVWHGSATGLGEEGAPHNADWEAVGSQSESYFGVSAATAGDVNGDGYADVIIGAHMQDNDEINEGTAFVYYGSPEGLGPGDGTPANADWTAESNLVNCQFGISAGTAGDVNGDGYGDVLVGAWRFNNGQNLEGAIFVWPGSFNGLGTDGTLTNAMWHSESNRANALYGTSVAPAGDVNGDGYSDVMAGAIGWTDHYLLEGAAGVFHGSSEGLKQTPGWVTAGTAIGQLCGFAVGSAGDINSDGYGDVLVGAPQYDGGQALEGRGLLYMGGSAGLSYTPAWTAESNRAGAHFGWSISTAGDVNGDGFSDVIIGARDYTKTETQEGAAFVWHGSSAGMGEAGVPENAKWITYSLQAQGYLGTSVGTAGDVNGDGYADVIVGAPGFTNGDEHEGAAFIWLGGEGGIDATPEGSPGNAIWTGECNQVNVQYGYSVDTAGDVNGDGLSDFVVGAPLYSHGESEEGAAFVYLGSREDLTDAYNRRIESNQPAAWLGVSVSAAGDVNGDGFGDVIIGAPLFDGILADEGRAFIFAGSSMGVEPSPLWWAGSEQSGSQYGALVAGAGDVNGDGFADVAVGAYQYSNGQSHEGKVYAYYGTATGPGFTPDFQSESNQADAILGFSVACAGDVNGDGCADLIVGAPSYDFLGNSVGGAFLCYGNQGRGLSLTPRQLNSSGNRPIDHLGSSDYDCFTLAMNGRTPFGRGKVRMQCEIKPLGVLFDGSGIQGASGWCDTGADGSVLSQTFYSLSQRTPYHWRVRLLYHPATTPYQPHSRWLTIPWGGWNESALFTGSRRNGAQYWVSFEQTRILTPDQESG